MLFPCQKSSHGVYPFTLQEIDRYYHNIPTFEEPNKAFIRGVLLSQVHISFSIGLEGRSCKIIELRITHYACTYANIF